MDIKPQGTSYKSVGFNGCLGSVIAGRKDNQWYLIMGHYANHEATITDTMTLDLADGRPEKCSVGNQGAAANKIPELWQTHRDLFRKDRQAFTYRPEKTGYGDMTDKLNEIVSNTTGLSPGNKEYTEKTASKGKARIKAKVDVFNNIKIKFAK
ncbi:unnamed protein product [Clonostachys solani]|uniref:Uncharacterized protein n=1 Tax=Clonostachys solani TaxID=160281 RepID=A0A9P0ENH5_9HYPO|nr:unnamed protein product [Clonostachys solani]